MIYGILDSDLIWLPREYLVHDDIEEVFHIISQMIL